MPTHFNPVPLGKGTGIAIVTPFTPEGRIDYSALERLIDHWIDGGVDYLVVMGTTGENVTLEKEEKIALFDYCSDAIAGRVPLVVGIGGNYTEEIIRNFSLYDLSKASAVLSVSPYYNKPNMHGVYEHFAQVAKNSPIPVILYNVPGRTGSNMTAEVTLKLAADFSNILGIKEASGNLDQISRIIKQTPREDFRVISGDDNLTLPILASGGDGVISVVANAYPAKFSQMVRLCLDGKFSEARRHHYDLFDFTNLLFADGSPGGVKTALEEMGFCSSKLRLPLMLPSDSVAEAIRSFVKHNPDA
jgi:4-hydroxy-tetrahydrodipicolinate synthase